MLKTMSEPRHELRRLGAEVLRAQSGLNLPEGRCLLLAPEPQVAGFVATRAPFIQPDPGGRTIARM
jgi:hypothetical protein